MEGRTISPSPSLSQPAITNMPQSINEFLSTLTDFGRRLQPLGQMAESAGGMFRNSPFAAFLPQGRAEQAHQFRAEVGREHRQLAATGGARARAGYAGRVEIPDHVFRPALGEGGRAAKSKNQDAGQNAHENFPFR